MKINLSDNECFFERTPREDWVIELIDTGFDTQTGGRLKRIKPYLDNAPFFFTYGDGLSDIDLSLLYDSHVKSNSLATVTAVQPSARYGALQIDDCSFVTSFSEKPQEQQPFVSGGYFILDPSVIDLIDGDSTVWEKYPLEHLASTEIFMLFVI